MFNCLNRRMLLGVFSWERRERGWGGIRCGVTKMISDANDVLSDKEAAVRRKPGRLLRAGPECNQSPCPRWRCLPPPGLIASCMYAAGFVDGGCKLLLPVFFF